MNQLESGLNKILEEHQHESGLHVIGGRRRLVDRLMQFFEEFKPETPEPRIGPGAAQLDSPDGSNQMTSISQKAKAKRITSMSTGTSTRISVSSGGGRLVS